MLAYTADAFTHLRTYMGVLLVHDDRVHHAYTADVCAMRHTADGCTHTPAYPWCMTACTMAALTYIAA